MPLRTLREIRFSRKGAKNHKALSVIGHYCGANIGVCMREPHGGPRSGGEAMSVNERFCEAKTKVLNVPL